MVASSISASSSSGRILAFDGLRGFAALVVVFFHYLAMLHPQWVADYASAPPLVVDTPLAVLWNGPFAVSIFFVLSGFVIAAAAERRHLYLIENTLMRYLRLAWPAVASVLLAWALLSLAPHAARDLAASMLSPSDWLEYTHQGSIPTIAVALQDGLASNFITGGSAFNNVLWTMQIEFIGSVLLFAVYWIGARAVLLRFLALAAFAALGLFVLRDAYLCFFFGALLYEARKAGWLEWFPRWSGVVALILGVMLGAPGNGFSERWGLDMMPGRLQPGNVWGLVPVFAASLILLGVQLLEGARRFFEYGPLQWLGRVSFALYLVHVPLLYTLLAWERVNLGLPEPVAASVYFLVTLGFAHLFTRFIDEPSLHSLRRLRMAADAFRAKGAAPGAVTAQMRGDSGPIWSSALLGMAALLPMTLINGGVSVYYDSIFYLHPPEGFLRLLSAMLPVDLAPVPAIMESAAPVAGAGGLPGLAAAATLVTAEAFPEATRVTFSGRSMFYQILAWSGLELGRLWSLAAVHALMVTYPAALLMSRVVGLAPGWPFVIGLAMLGLLTPLGLFVGIAMPDILVGALVLSVAVLMLGWSALRWNERCLLFALATFSMVSHTSHFLLGFVLPMAILMLQLRNAAMWRGAGFIGLACLSALALEQVKTALQEHDSDAVLLIRPHLVAHLMDHGPGVTYLREACPQAGFEMCNHIEHLPIEWREFLFGGTDPQTRFFVDASPAVQGTIGAEQFALTRAVVAHDLIAVIDFAARAWLRQIVRFDPAGGMVQGGEIPHGEAPLPIWFAAYPDWLKKNLRELFAFEQSWVLPALHASTWLSVLLTLAAVGAVLRQRQFASFPSQGVLVFAALMLGVVLNAAICGILASPYDRFQARIIWLIPLAGLALFAARRMPAG